MVDESAAPVPTTAPAVAPAPAWYPPPVDARTERQIRRDQLRQEKEDRRVSQQLARDKRRAQQQALLDKDAYHGRFFVGPHFTLQGKGKASSKYDTYTQLGFDAGFEFRMNMAFGLGPSIRYQRISFRDTTVVDININPTIHFPFGVAEVVVPLQFGLAMGWDDHSIDGDGPLNSDGAGFAIGAMPGIILWPIRTFGIYANVGLTGHLMYLGYSSNFYTTAASAGVTFSY